MNTIIITAIFIELKIILNKFYISGFLITENDNIIKNKVKRLRYFNVYIRPASGL